MFPIQKQEKSALNVLVGWLCELYPVIWLMTVTLHTGGGVQNAPTNEFIYYSI